MRIAPADVGDEAGEHTTPEFEHVRRGDVVGHQYERVFPGEVALAVGRRIIEGIAAQSPQRGDDALDHLFQVGLAVAQVFVLHLVELARDHFQLRRQRPLGVVVALDDPLPRGLRQGVVLQQHQVDVQQRDEFVVRVLGNVALERGELLDDQVARGAQALDLGLDHPGFDVIVGDVDPARRDEHRTTDRDAARYRKTEHLNAHEPTSANRTPGTGRRPGGFERSM